MSIGDKSAFAGKEEKVKGRDYYEVYNPGMTYRQWLIGQIAPSVMSNHFPSAFGAETVVEYATAIVEALDAEANNANN